MKKTPVIYCLIFFTALMLNACHNLKAEPSKTLWQTKDIHQIYDDCGLKGKLSFDIFQLALDKASHFKMKNRKVITIIDFSKPSTEKRCFVIDLENRKILFRTLVAHGDRCGVLYATAFSNKGRTHMSSLGLYRTAETYKGSHGYSLRLDGLEKGLNDNARNRAIVLHGAKYVSEDFIKKHGHLGRSWGCPALPVDVTPKIIDVIKNGTPLYIYGKKFIR